MKKSVTGLEFLVCLVLITGVPTLASAQDESAASEEATSDESPQPEENDSETPRARARAHFLQGIRLAERQQWEAALAEFDESLRLYPTRSALFNRAVSLQHLNRYTESVAALEEVFTRYADELTEARRRQVQQVLDELMELLTAVTVEANVEGATVSVDGNEVGTTPLARPLLLLSGLHMIELRREGYRPARRDVAVVSGERMNERFTLVEPPRMGVVRVEANVAEGEVLVDGLEVGALPYRGVLPAGIHEVEVTAPGWQPATQTVSVVAEDDRSISLTLERPRRVQRAWFYGLLAVSVTGVLATGGLGAATLVLDHQYDEYAADAADRQDQGRVLMRATDAALGVTCASALATLIIAFFTDWVRPAPRARSAGDFDIPSFETGDDTGEFREGGR